jgi:antitoxin component YwqK of YwqJK toxin-antitoxin module
MKSVVCLLVCLFSASITSAQITEIKKKTCYEKSTQRKNQRFLDWECGKGDAVDCNEKLDLDPSTNIVFASNSSKPFTGVCETCFMNGIRERKVTFVNGKEEGIDTSYYESGCPMVVRNHIQGVENGQWIYYYDSTAIMAWEMNYIAGAKHGKHIFFAKNGDTMRWENYQNGVLQGVKRTYYPNSKIEKEVTYDKGLLNGSFVIYTPKGIVLEKLNYKQGKKDGECVYYYDDGTLLRTENWSMDVKNGSFKTLYYQGFVQLSENYKKGLKEGWFEERFPDQKMKRQALYKKDVLIEEHVFNDKGKEISTFGGTATKGSEDDAMPSTEKAKKPKKAKKVKAKKGETPPAKTE